MLGDEIVVAVLRSDPLTDSKSLPDRLVEPDAAEEGQDQASDRKAAARSLLIFAGHEDLYSDVDDGQDQDRQESPQQIVVDNPAVRPLQWRLQLEYDLVDVQGIPFLQSPIGAEDQKRHKYAEQPGQDHGCP